MHTALNEAKSLPSSVAYYRHWHYYPSGRTEERIVRIDPSGRTTSIRRTRDANEFVEFTVTTTLRVGEPTPTFETHRFGIELCSASAFEAFRTEAIAHLNRDPS
jgi:hypothetical protein